MMASYDVYFATILRHELHDTTFDELTNLSFPYMILKLQDKVVVPDLPKINERVIMTTTTYFWTIKGLALLCTSRKLRQWIAVPQSQSETTTVLIKPDEGHKDDIGIIVEIDIKEKRDAQDLSTQGVEIQATSF